jgi:acetylornithine deacetylase/succinyl-diaminopimelate desuccinylase-like protein
MSDEPTLPVSLELSDQAQAVTQWITDLSGSAKQWLDYAQRMVEVDENEAIKALATASDILAEIEKHYGLQEQVIGGLVAVAQEALRERDKVVEERDRLEVNLEILEAETEDRVEERVQEEIDYLNGNGAAADDVIVENLVEQIFDRGYDDVRRETWDRTDHLLEEANARSMGMRKIHRRG